MSPTIFISAGEASGEHYGALLIEALKRQLAATGQTASFFGMAGNGWPRQALIAWSARKTWPSWGSPRSSAICHASMRVPQTQAGSSRPPPRCCRAHRLPRNPLQTGQRAAPAGVPVIFFVSPQLWAWKKHRIKLVRKYVSKMLVIFPFEEPFYRERGVEAEFVGHPLAELPLPTICREEFADAMALTRQQPGLACFPAAAPRRFVTICRKCSRPHRALPSPNQAIPVSAPAGPDSQSPAASRGPGHAWRTRQWPACETGRGRRAALFHARASVVASGTATVEAALIGNPFVVVYRVSKITYAIAKRIVKVPHIAMANLIAAKRVVRS